MFEQLIRLLTQQQPTNFEVPQDYLVECLVMPPFKLLKRNKYLDKATYRSVCDHDEVPQCMCKEESGCAESCQNRLLFMECCQDNCPTLRNKPFGSFCSNSAIHRSDFPQTEMFLTTSCGYGLRVCENVPAKTILCEYLGEVITAAECKQQIVRYKKNEDFYFAALEQGLVLDAKAFGSFARFANHSCNPNCEMQKWMVMGEPRIVLVSKRPLKEGDEITYNYNYFDDGLESELRMRRQRCCCLAANCSGTIGGRVREVESSSCVQWKENAEDILSGQKRYNIDRILEIFESWEEEFRGEEELGALNDRLGKVISDVNDWKLEYFTMFAGDVSKGSRHFELQKSSKFVGFLTALDLFSRIPHVSIVKTDEGKLLEEILQLGLAAMKQIKVLQQITTKKKVVVKEEIDVKQEVDTSYDLESQSHSEQDDSSYDKITRIERKSQSFIQVASDLHATLSAVGSWGSGKLFWNDVVIGVKAILQAVPLHIPGAEYLVQLYNAHVQWSTSCLQAFGLCVEPKSLGSGSSSSSSSSSKSPHQRARGALEQDIHLYERLSKIYTFKPTHPSSGISSEIMKIEDPETCREENANINVQKSASRDEAAFSSYFSGTNSIHLTAFLGEAVDFILEKRQILLSSLQALQSRLKGKPQKDGDNDGLLCFCQQLEHKSEVNSFVQCDYCDNWFHPQCVNDTIRLQSAKTAFYCPLCLFSRDCISQYGFAPKDSAEWKINVKYSMLDTCKSLHQDISRASAADDAERDSRKHRRRIAPKAYIFAAVDTITYDQLETMIKMENDMQLNSCPAAVLLTLMKEEVNKWREEVALLTSGYLAQQLWEKGAAPTRQAMDTVNDSVTPAVASKALLLLLLIKCLRLFYHLRVSRIACKELLALRQLIWSISVTPLAISSECDGAALQVPITALTNLVDSCANNSSLLVNILYAKNEEEYQSCLEDFVQFLKAECQAIPTEAIEKLSRFVSVHPKEVSISDYRRIIQGGQLLKADSSFAYKEICKVFADISAAVTSCMHAKTVEECQEKIDTLDKYAICIPQLRSCFAYVRARNVLHCQQRVSLQQSEELRAEPDELYCYCQQRDDGSTMIQCDGCNEWYHATCIGYIPLPPKKKKYTPIAAANKRKRQRLLESVGLVSNNQQVEDNNTGTDNDIVDPSTAQSDVDTPLSDDDSFYCIPCCEQRNKKFQYQDQFIMWS